LAAFSAPDYRSDCLRLRAMSNPNRRAVDFELDHRHWIVRRTHASGTNSGGADASSSTGGSLRA
jgi:hypothetical protein